MGVSNPLIACRASAPRSGLKPGGKLRLMAPSLKAGVKKWQQDKWYITNCYILFISWRLITVE